MIVRAQDKNGDMQTRGTQYVRDVSAVELLVKMRLKMFYGEYFRDNTDGTEWWERVLGKHTDRVASEYAIRSRIERTPGVMVIRSFETTYEERTISVQCSFDTIYGEGSVTYATDYE